MIAEPVTIEAREIRAGDRFGRSKDGSRWATVTDVQIPERETVEVWTDDDPMGMPTTFRGPWPVTVWREVSR
jgi:hypothetical protein